MSFPTEKAESIFPLAFVAKEKWLIVEDRLDGFMNFWIDLDFSGRFEQNAFKKAVSLAIKKHPLFSAFIKGDIKEKVSKIFWIEAKGAVPFVDWDEEGSPLKFPKGRPIDLRREIGIRFFVREGPHRTNLLIQFHHACADGMGAVHFIKDLLRLYALSQANSYEKSEGLNGFKKLENETSQSLKYKKELLLDRDHYRLRKGSFKNYFLQLREVLRFHFQFPKTLAVRNPSKKMLGEPDEYPAYISYTFTRNNTKTLCLSAVKRDVVLLSLLLRDLFLAIDHWNRQINPKERNRSIRIAVPMDLRHLLKPDMPAITTLGLIFIHQKRKWLEDPDRLLKAINKFLLTSVKRNWALIFLKGLNFFGKFKHGINTLAKSKRCWSTALLTYFGEINQFFSAQNKEELFNTTGLKLEHVTSGVVLINKNYVGFYAGIFDGRLNISITYCPDKVSEEDARGLLSLYVDKISGSMSLPQALPIRAEVF